MNSKTLSIVAILAILCSALLLFSPATEATDGPMYGSNTEPYSGLHVNYMALEDGATYYLVDNGTVYIDCSETDLGNIDSQLEGTGLNVDMDSKTVYGQIEKTCTLTIGEKTFTIMDSGRIYGDHPSYGVAVDAFPDATVGTFYRETILLNEGGGLVAPDTGAYLVHESSADLADYNLSISFSHELVNNTKWRVLATISGTPVTDGTITMEIWSDDHPIGHAEYTTSITINKPVYTITFDPGNGTCPVRTMTYHTAQDDLELPEATPSQSGYHFTGWYTDPSGGTFVGSGGDNPFDVFTPNGNFTLYAHYEEDTNPVVSITISGSSSIGIGESTTLNALATLLHPNEDGNRHVVWDLIDGEGVVTWGAETNLETGGRITVTGVSVGTATFRAMAADGSTDSEGDRISDYFTISVSESSSVERNSFTLVYDLVRDDATNPPPTFSVPNSTQPYYETQVAMLIPKCDGQTFLGWSYNPSAEVVDLEPGDPISLPPGKTYLYAVWEPIETMWTLSFDPNGGTGGPPQIQEYETGQSHTFRIPGAQYNPNPPDASKEFGGWTRQPGSNIVAAYPGGSLYTTEQDTILYAIWNDVSESNVFTLHFDANRGEGAHDDITNYSQDNTYVVELPDKTPTRPGYAFLGWSLNPYWNEGDDYYPASSSITLYPGTTTLYAIWSQTNFTITFNVNNGTGGPGTVIASGTGEAQVMIPTSPDPIRDGYTFLGWSTNPNGPVDPEYAKGRLVTITENVTLYAVWSQNSQPGGDDEKPEELDYEFHFIVEEGVENVPEDVVVKGDENGVNFEFPDNILESEGRTFLGWSNRENSDSVVWYAGESYSFTLADRINYFYPVWEVGIDTWSLSFHPNGGIGAPPTQYEIAENGSCTFIIPADQRPTRSGFTFLGWDEDPNTSRPALPVTDTDRPYNATKQDTILYAIWAEGNEDTFVLTFDANGGSDAPGSLSGQDVGSHRFTIPLQYPNLDGQIFVGWSDSPTGGIVAYVGGTYVASSQDVTLYAVWVADDGTSKNFTVFYQPFEDAELIERLIASNGNTAVHTLMTEDDEGFVPRVGYEFVGWSETEGGKVIEDDTYTTGAMNVVLYGVWSSTSTTFPEATFDYTVDGLTVSFDASQAPNALTWYWDLGDGTKVGLASFEHTFPSAGTYLVSLTVSNGGQQDVKRMYITVEDDSSSIWIYVAIIAIVAIMIVAVLHFKGVI